MRRTPLQFGKQTYQARGAAASVERLVNMYVEQNPEGSPSRISLYTTPGLKSPFVSVGTGPIRGLLSALNRIWIVSGNELYFVKRGGQTQLVGAVNGVGSVSMIANSTHIAVAGNNSTYAANESEIIELPEKNLNGAAYMDGYGIFTQEGTEKFWITGLDDMTTISALDFSSADVYPDVGVGLIDSNREVLIFGARSIEPWYNSGNASFPFGRAQGGVMEIGCSSGKSIAKIGETIFWLGDDSNGRLQVYAMAGRQPRAISTPAIDAIITERSSISSCDGFAYHQGGHSFYMLTWTDKTIAYDLNTGLWHERESRDLGRWRGNHHAYAWQTHYVGDWENGNIYELDLGTYDDNGEIITRDSYSPIIRPPVDRSIMHDLEITVDLGQGLNDGQGDDPELHLRWSDDQGRTWSSGTLVSIGEIGEYQNQVLFTRLGAFKSRVFRLSFSDPCKLVIHEALARIEALG